MSWKEALYQGNQFFTQQHWLDAERCYLSAADVLEEEISKQQYNMEYLFAWIASMHNLSTLYEVLGDTRKAYLYFVLPFEHVSGVYDAGGLDVEMMHRALKTVTLPFLDFSKRYPIPQEYLQQTQAAKHWLSMLMQPCQCSCQHTNHTHSRTDANRLH